MSEKKSYDKKELQLKLVACFGGYERDCYNVQRPYWVFSHFAVVTEKKQNLVNVINGREYIDSKDDVSFIEIGAERAFPPFYNGVWYSVLLKEQNNSLLDIKRAMTDSGLYFGENLSLQERFGAFIKSLKR